MGGVDVRRRSDRSLQGGAQPETPAARLRDLPLV